MPVTQGYSFDPTKLSDQELNDHLQFYKNGLAKDNPSNPYSGASLGLVQRIEEEQHKRNATNEEAKRKSDLEAILGQNNQNAAQGLQDSNAYEQRQRQNLEDIFNTAKQSGTNALNESYATDRGRAIDEASAAGLSRMPGFLTKTLGDVDTRKSNSLRDLMLGLDSKRAEGRLGLEDTLFNRGVTNQGLNFQQQGLGLQKAGLLQGGNQFNQSLGLQRDQFGEQKRRSSLEDIFNQQSLDQAGALGRMQADAAKPSFLDQFAKVTGGLGQLAGGIGSLSTYFKKPIVPGDGRGEYK